MPEETSYCPFCGKQILAVARKCRYCGQYLDPSLRAEAQQFGAVERAMLPVGRPFSAIAAGYLGLFSLFPLIGIAAGLGAVICGIFALRVIKKDPILSGKGRAWFGIAAGAIGFFLWSTLLVLMIIGAFIDARR